MESTPTVQTNSGDQASQKAGASSYPSLAARLLSLRVTTLRWAIGGFCIILGALMSVIPHQVNSPAFAFMRSFVPWVGTIYLLFGVGLIAVAALRPHRYLSIALHMAAGSALLFYAMILLGVVSVGGWSFFFTLGLGTIIAGLLPDRADGTTVRGGNFFALLVGVCSASIGLVMMAMPDQFQSASYDPIRPFLVWFGLVFLIGGILLSIVELYPRRPRWLSWLVHILVAAIFLVYMALVSIPNGSITGVALYGGFGLLLLLLPWLEESLVWVDSASLQLRLALTLVITAALPLTLTVAVITDEQEAISTEQALTNQRAIAVSQAQNIADYIQLHRAAVEALAAQLASDMSNPAVQGAQLQTFTQIYPDFSACGTFDGSGQAIASTHNDLTAATSSSIASEIQRAQRSIVRVYGVPEERRSVIVFGMPLSSPSNTPRSSLICSLDLAHLADKVAQLSHLLERNIYVVDDQGRVIAQPGDVLVPTLADRSQIDSVAALRRSREPGFISYGEGNSTILSGYAPIQELDWGVVVERSAASSLQNVQQARELAFILLFVVIVGALLVGILLAKRLTAPLHSLLRAMDSFSAGDADAPLPQETTTELAQLAQAFDRMRAQVMASASEREAAIQLRDQFFSVAAHELKTPLTSLLGQAQLLQRRMLREETLTERNQRALGVVVNQAQRLNKLIVDLLDISRLQQGHFAIERATIDLTAVVNQVSHELEPTLDQHTLVRTGIQEPLMLRGDGARLEQVFQNLVGNAIKYSPAGGTITVELSRQPGEALIKVIDEGIGIPESAQAQLFQQFYRAPNAERENIVGLGIGLYVVYQIVALHQGRVTVASVEGQGSTFTVFLPIEE